jgi:hypothetical protein
MAASWDPQRHPPLAVACIRCQSAPLSEERELAMYGRMEKMPCLQLPPGAC